MGRRPLTEAVEIARPLQSLQLTGLRGPRRRTATTNGQMADRQALYTSGIGALVFGPDGTPQIDRLCTTYQTNPAGAADITFLDIENLAVSAYVIQYLKNLVLTTYPRCVLLDDNPGNLQGVATPAEIRATLIHGYTDLATTGGVVESVDLFAKYLIVERSSDPNRVDVYLPIDVANQLRIVATNATIYPQLSDAVGSGLTG